MLLLISDTNILIDIEIGGLAASRSVSRINSPSQTSSTMRSWRSGIGYTLSVSILRAFFVLLLCVMLPMSGLAASGLTARCPMQADMSNLSGSSVSTEMPDCDAMQSTSSPDTTKRPSCKMTAQCQMGSLYHATAAPTMHRSAGFVSPVVFHYRQSLFVHNVSGGVWRPPREL